MPVHLVSPCPLLVRSLRTLYFAAISGRIHRTAATQRSSSPRGVLSLPRFENMRFRTWIPIFFPFFFLSDAEAPSPASWMTLVRELVAFFFSRKAFLSFCNATFSTFELSGPSSPRLRKDPLRSQKRLSSPQREVRSPLDVAAPRLRSRKYESPG